jgi:hypothetical protein
MARRNIWTDEKEGVLLASLLTAMKEKQTEEQWFEALHTPDKDGKKPLGSKRTYSLAKCISQAKILKKIGEKQSPPIKITIPSPAPRPKPKTKAERRAELIASMGFPTYKGKERADLESKQAQGIKNALKARQAKEAKAKAAKKPAKAK